MLRDNDVTDGVSRVAWQHAKGDTEMDPHMAASVAREVALHTLIGELRSQIAISHHKAKMAEERKEEVEMKLHFGVVEVKSSKCKIYLQQEG